MGCKTVVCAAADKMTVIFVRVKDVLRDATDETCDEMVVGW